MAIIKLSGKATVHRASQILEMCQQALRESGDSIQVDWSDIEALDASVLQILLALRRSRPTRFTEPPESIRETLTMLGVAELLR